MPAFLQKENKNGVPANALWVSNAAIQVFLVITLFSSSSYLSLLYLATSMILMPYFFSTVYAVMIALRSEGYTAADNAQRYKDLLIGLVAVVYSVWLLYAAGAKYLLLSALLYAPGALLYIKARRENQQPVFNNLEKVYLVAAVAGAVWAAIGLYTGSLTL